MLFLKKNVNLKVSVNYQINLCCLVFSQHWKISSYNTESLREHANLGIFWLREDSVEDLENLPSPEVLASEITQNLETALELFQNIQAELGDNV